MKRWSKNVPGKDIFNLSKLFFPINDNNHWTCAVVQMEEKKIVYYDSLRNNGTEYQLALLQYLVDEYLDKKKQKLDKKLWTLVSDQSKTPQQINSKLSYVKYLSIF